MFYSNSILLDLHVCTEPDNFNACLAAAFCLKMNNVKIIKWTSQIVTIDKLNLLKLWKRCLCIKKKNKTTTTKFNVKQ